MECATSQWGKKKPGKWDVLEDKKKKVRHEVGSGWLGRHAAERASKMTREVTIKFGNTEVNCVYLKAWSPLEMGLVEKDRWESEYQDSEEWNIFCKGEEEMVQ